VFQLWYSPQEQSYPHRPHTQNDVKVYSGEKTLFNKVPAKTAEPNELPVESVLRGIPPLRHRGLRKVIKLVPFRISEDIATPPDGFNIAILAPQRICQLFPQITDKYIYNFQFRLIHSPIKVS